MDLNYNLIAYCILRVIPTVIHLVVVCTLTVQTLIAEFYILIHQFALQKSHFTQIFNHQKHLSS